MKWFFIIIAFTIIACSGFAGDKKTHTEKAATTKKMNGPLNSFAVLELFTSEGCSSCPPADRLLPQLAIADSNIIALSFHVDYWNHLGWQDPFSSAEFSERQKQYGEHFRLESIYTPQLIINGEYELVGSNRSTAEADIKKVLKEKASMEINIDGVKKENGRLYINCHTKGDWKNTGILTAVVQKHTEMNVKGGENKGFKLSHTNVVRSFVKQPAHELMKFDIEIPKDVESDNWELIMYAQQTGTRKITGVATYQPVTGNQ
jgi:hypothetical protein